MAEDQVDLITACINGDETAVAQLVQEHQLGVFRFAFSILNDPSEANEATQEVFISVLRALKSYKETTPFKAWIFKITLNICRSRLRKRKTQERLHDKLKSIIQVHSQASPSLEEMVILKEEDEVLWELLRSLGERHRIPLVLRYYHDLKINEIAELMNLKEGTVHSRLSTGRERLRLLFIHSHKISGD